MNRYELTCCSTADLSKEHLNDRNIKYVCFHFELGGKEYLDDLGESISSEELYSAMTAGAGTKTSQVSVDEYVEFFKPMLEAGSDILHVSLSSGISGTYNSANIAREMLQHQFPDRKLYLVDSLGASSGYGLIMDTLADMRDKGMDIDTLYHWIEEHKLNLHHWFFSSDLTFYIRGGRISKAAGFLGTILGICPLLNMDAGGHLIPREKVRTKKKVILRIAEKMEENAEQGLNYNGKCFICQSACYEDARAVADIIEDRFKNLKGKVQIYNIGATIGSHTGPGTVALFFWGKKRID